MPNVYVINRGLETRTLRSGKRKHTIRIDAEPMYINQDPKSLGQPVADAIATHYRERIRGIAATASAATLAYRKKAQAAFKAGKSWATRRYAGGRTGPKEPNQSDRLFNDSGRFADTIIATASASSWRINVAANRLDEKTAGVAGVERIWNRLIQLVPEFGDVSLLFEANAIARRTLQRVAQERIQKGRPGKRVLSGFEAFSALFLRPAA